MLTVAVTFYVGWCSLTTGASLKAFISVADQPSAGPASGGTFSYSKPVITSISCMVPTPLELLSLDDVLAIEGVNASDAAQGPAGTLLSPHTFQWLASAVSPSGSDGSVDNSSANSSVAPTVRGPTVGGFNVTVTGVNFGAVGSAGRRCIFARSSEVHVTPTCNGVEDAPGEGEIPPSHVLFWNHTTIVFIMPPGTTRLQNAHDVCTSFTGGGVMWLTCYCVCAGIGHRDVFVMVNGQQPASLPTGVVHYFPPALLSISPNATGTTGGDTVTLTGSNLGASLSC